MRLARGNPPVWRAILAISWFWTIGATVLSQFPVIAKTGLDKKKVLAQSMVTPSCGTGSMQADDAEKVFSLLGQTSKALKAKYGF